MYGGPLFVYYDEKEATCDFIPLLVQISLHKCHKTFQ